MKAQQVCEVCGNSLLKYWTNPKTSYQQLVVRKRFCSKGCAAIWRQRHWYDEAFTKGTGLSRANANPRFKPEVPDRICLHCGRQFRKYPAAVSAGRGRYCSHACRLAAKAKPRVTCDVCGKAIPRSPSLIRKAKRHFCSKKCESLGVQGERNHFYGKQHSEETIRRILAKIHSRPNGAEEKLIALFHSRGFPFRYVGDGSFYIGGLNPDFVRTDGGRQLIELFGHGFHDPSHRLRKGKIRPHQTVEGRKAFLQDAGFETLILWDTELKDEGAVIAKVTAFLKGGDR